MSKKTYRISKILKTEVNQNPLAIKICKDMDIPNIAKIKTGA
jgi:hypothetical protein